MKQSNFFVSLKKMDLYVCMTIQSIFYHRFCKTCQHTLNSLCFTNVCKSLRAKCGILFSIEAQIQYKQLENIFQSDPFTKQALWEAPIHPPLSLSPSLHLRYFFCKPFLPRNMHNKCSLFIYY